MASDMDGCPHTNRETDSSLGQVHCLDCGCILEEGTVVSEVQFQETGGRSVAQGILFNLNGSGLNRWSFLSMADDIPDSHNVTIQKVSKTLRPKAADLKFTEEQTNAAIGVYKMALRYNLTRGRKFEHCMAACLYIVCRMYKINLMLLDLSDYFQINVYTLGKTYLQISNGLHIATPVIEPTIYISRFAARLELGGKRTEVERTANRIVQRMNRDWMTTGRRPSGLCGAALLVAARMHNFSRTVKDMVKVVKICEATIRKRLMEFHDVPSSELSIEHFGTVSPSKEEDPPCFTEGKRKSSMAEQISQEKLRVLTVEISGLQEEIEETLESTAKKPRGIWAKFAKMGDAATCTAVSSSDGNATEITQFLESEVLKEVLGDELGSSQTGDSGTAPSTPVKESPVETDFKTVLTPSKLILGSRQSSAALGLGAIVPQCLSASKVDASDSEDDNGELDLTGIDDKEIDSLLLTEEETKIKTEIWMKQNGEALRELEEKEEQKARELAESGPKPVKKRKSHKRKALTEASSTQDAIVRIIQNKKLSNKINYDVLKDLQPSTPSTSMASATPTDVPVSEVNSSAVESSVETPKPVDESVVKEPPRKRARRSNNIKPKVVEKLAWTSMSSPLMGGFSSGRGNSFSLSTLSSRRSPMSATVFKPSPPAQTLPSKSKEVDVPPREKEETQPRVEETQPRVEEHSEEPEHLEGEEHLEDDEHLEEEEEEEIEDEGLPAFMTLNHDKHAYDEDEYYD